ncbi:MAG: DUF4214 domain-containing protein [Acidimicrobiales bacterium]
MAPNANLHRRRKRRVLGTLGGALVAWGALAGLPLGADPARPGEMHTEIVSLTGPDADAGARASSAPGARAAGVGWSTHLDVDDGTQAVASSWTGAPDGAVEVRGLGDGGWTDWTELESEEGEGPDDSARDTGGMAWFGRDGVREVELRVTAGELHDLELQTMRYEAPSGGSSLTTAVAGADAAQPTIIPRSTYTSKGWATGNSGCSGGPTTASGGVKFAVVHHTVNSNTYSASDVPALLASIYAYHTGTNGWCDIAYNFVVDRFGRIWEGRSGGVAKAIVGGHAQGFNTGSVGVSFLGQYEPSASPTAASPSVEAIDAAGKLIGWKLGLSGIDPTGSVTVTSGGSNKYPAGTSVTLKRVIGHRDVGYTACPGQNLYDELSDIRTIAKTAQGGSTTTTTTAPTTTTTTPPPTAFAPFTTASQLVAQQYRDVLRREPTSDDLAFWTARVGDTWTPGQFIAHLQSSTEADNRVHAVTRLYRAYFLRNPDHNGLTYWLNRRGEGRSLVSISNSFAVSSEFTNRYGKLSNRAFVDRVYLNVLGRSADAGGATYWTARLDGGMSRGQVMANFSQSSEYIRDTDDAVWVVGTYEALLRRAAPADVFTLFTAGLANGQASLTSISTYVFESSEYRSRFS